MNVEKLHVTGHPPSPRYFFSSIFPRFSYLPLSHLSFSFLSLFISLSPFCSYYLIFVVRYGMSGIVYKEDMYIFGGYDNEGQSCNDCFKFNLGT